MQKNKFFTMHTSSKRHFWLIPLCVILCYSHFSAYALTIENAGSEPLFIEFRTADTNIELLNTQLAKGSEAHPTIGTYNRFSSNKLNVLLFFGLRFKSKQLFSVDNIKACTIIASPRNPCSWWPLTCSETKPIVTYSQCGSPQED